MSRRSSVAVVILALLQTLAASQGAADPAYDRAETRALYFVVLDEAAPRSRSVAAAQQRPIQRRVMELGGEIRYRYSVLFNAFSAEMSSEAAALMATLPEVERVVPVSIARRSAIDPVDFIGADAVRERYGLNGKGITVAVVDSGVDYTHAAFGGPGTRRAFDNNDPAVVEPGSFPTGKVIGGTDLVGDDYSPTDRNPDNDLPQPDGDPLDNQGHGTHVAGTCCGKGVRGVLGKGVAPRSKILAFKVWGHSGSSTADVLVAAFEAAVDPNGDGDTSDRADVLSFSGGVNFGTAESIESIAAQRVVEEGTVFVAAAGNAGSEYSGGLAYRVGAPASAPAVIAVAASMVPDDEIVGFSSQGPSRYTSALKPDISAPGANILSAAAGSGSDAVSLSGTSMATPHVSGAAALLLQRFPAAPPAQIKALLMNRAVRGLEPPQGSDPDVTLEGAGRVDVAAAASASFFVDPPSVSFGVAELVGRRELPPVRVTITDLDDAAAVYRITSGQLDDNLDAEFAEAALSIDGDDYSQAIEMDAGTSDTSSFWLRVTLDGAAIAGGDQARRWYEELSQISGVVKVKSVGRPGAARIVWHALPLPISQIEAPDSVALDPSTGTGTLTFQIAAAAGVAHVDLYQAGVSDPPGDTELAEADIVAVGLRSFTGVAIGDGPEGVPTEVDPLRGLTWRESVRGGASLREPVEVVVVTGQSNETIESPSVDLFIDAGADASYVDPDVQADYVVSKEVGEADWCVIDIAATTGDCTELYAGDYPTYLTRVLGVVIDVTALGLDDQVDRISVRTRVCSDGFSGDVPTPVCDLSDPVTLDVTEPEIGFGTLVCGGFWSVVSCAEPVSVMGDPGATGLLVFPAQPDPYVLLDLE